MRGLVLLGLLTSCTALQPELFADDRQFVPRDLEELWATGQTLQEHRNEEFQRRASQEVYTRLGGRLEARSLLDKARSAFEEEKYHEARGLYLGFLNLFPRHELVGEAHYFLGLSYFNEMLDVDRDQSFTRRALKHFEAVLQKADSPYAVEARAKLDPCRRRLAEKELYVGTFYMRRGRYAAALGRFETILDKYQGNGLDDQALFYKGEALLRLERQEEAQAAFRDLLEDHPGSPVVKKAASRLVDLVPVR
ncbi:MAG: outer membrane protein assembly factor BamD [Candidatus Methylomirabilales bacterium]